MFIAPHISELQHRMMMAPSGVITVLLGLVVICLGADDCSNNKYTNGCSIPFNLPWFYKKEFTPDCHKHDICYYCVSKIKLEQLQLCSIFQPL